MKIHIWIKKEDAISGNITKYYNTIPQLAQSDYENYVEVSITQDEFAVLEDSSNTNNSVVYESDLDNENIQYIFERNPDTGKIYKRKKGDYDNRKEVKAASITRPKERTASVDDMVNFVKTLNGGEFRKWYDRASEEEIDLYGLAFQKMLDEYKNSK